MAQGRTPAFGPPCWAGQASAQVLDLWAISAPWGSQGLGWAGLGRRGLFGGSSSAPLPPRRRVCRWPTAHVDPRKQDRAKGLRAEAKGSCTAICPLHWGGLEGHS